LLVFWCFLSGFSEKLVPAILSRMESRVVEEERPGTRPVEPSQRPREEAAPATSTTPA
jgi:hypothetical protein